MKLAVISGASAGIGLATARLFHAKGYRVLNISRRSTTDQFITDLHCDLADPTAIQRIAEELRVEYQKSAAICLVHNACHMASGTVIDFDNGLLRKVLEVNLIAPNALNQLTIPAMKHGSAIIYIGSTLSEKAVANSFSYVTSKHAIVGMMRATCQDLVGKGIHTACVCPGFTDTEMLRLHLDNAPDELEQVQQMNSFKRLIKPEEIADLIVWAAENPVINGSVLHANLGQIER